MINESDPKTKIREILNNLKKAKSQQSNHSNELSKHERDNYNQALQEATETTKTILALYKTLTRKNNNTNIMNYPDSIEKLAVKEIEHLPTIKNVSSKNYRSINDIVFITQVIHDCNQLCCLLILKTHFPAEITPDEAKELTTCIQTVSNYCNDLEPGTWTEIAGAFSGISSMLLFAIAVALVLAGLETTAGIISVIAIPLLIIGAVCLAMRSQAYEERYQPLHTLFQAAKQIESDAETPLNPNAALKSK